MFNGSEQGTTDRPGHWVYTCVYEYLPPHVCRGAGLSETRLLGMKGWPYWSGAPEKGWGAHLFPPELGDYIWP